MYRSIESLINSKQDFAFETTLSSKGYLRTIERAKAVGYFVTLVFFWLEKVDLAIERVKSRVATGGHHIPEEVIRRRYRAGAKNFMLMYRPVCDYWMVIDNSKSPMSMVANGYPEETTENIFEKETWEQLNAFINEN